MEQAFATKDELGCELLILINNIRCEAQVMKYRPAEDITRRPGTEIGVTHILSTAHRPQRLG